MYGIPKSDNRKMILVKWFIQTLKIVYIEHIVLIV